METRTLTPSGIQLPILGLGCWSFGGQEGDYWGPHDDREAAEIVARALDSGVNYFDTAEGYNEGRSEAALGRALAGRRHEAIIGTKVSPNNTAPATLRQHCEASLRRLDTDTIDIYMVHWPITDHPVADAFATLADLRAEGKIRAIGISNFGPTQLQEAVATGVPLEVNQLGYSLLNRTIEFEILPACQQYGIGVAAYMPLMQGLLSGRWRSADEIPQVRRRTRHFSGARPPARHGEPGAEAEVFAAIAGIAESGRCVPDADDRSGAGLGRRAGGRDYGHRGNPHRRTTGRIAARDRPAAGAGNARRVGSPDPAREDETGIERRSLAVGTESPHSMKWINPQSRRAPPS